MWQSASQGPVDRFYLLAPALTLLAMFIAALIVYAVLCVSGRAPKLDGVKHNQLFGPFLAGFLVWLIRPIERVLIGRVSPNVVTLASVSLCAATGVCLAIGQLAIAVWLWAFAGILDVLDGRLARLTDHQTAAGSLLDSVSDRWGELFVFCGYAWFLHDSLWVVTVIAALGGSMMVSYTRARSEALGVAMQVGVMQRAERIVLVTGGTLFAAWYGAAPDAAGAVVPIVGGTLALCALTSGITAVSRFVCAYRVLVQRRAPAIVPDLAVASPAPARIPSRVAPQPARPAA